MNRWVNAAVLVLSLVVACEKEKPAEDKGASAPKPSPVPKASADSKPVDKPASKPSKPAPPKKQPSAKADAAKLTAYWKGMNEGRTATLAKQFTEAYAAFGNALVAMPDDARAISERGYARLLAKDYKGAVVDLDHAVARTKDKKLLGQIFYNYGLAAEANGNAAAAQAAFARSNAYNPTPAAQKKMQGKSVCTAVIADKQPASEAKSYPSWKAAYDDAKSEFAYLDAWVSDDATLPAFCSNPWKKGASCVATVGDVAAMEGRVYVPAPSGKVFMFALDMVGGRCGGDITATLKHDENDVTHVSWTATQGIPVAVKEKNGEIVDCGEKDDDCTTACGDDSVTHSDLFIAKDQGSPMVFVSRAAENDKDPLKVTLEMPVVKIAGKGCDTERPLAK